MPLGKEVSVVRTVLATGTICLLLGLLLGACGPPAVPTEAPTEIAAVPSPTSTEVTTASTETSIPPTDTPILPTPTYTPVPPAPTLTLAPAEPAFTQITMDGQLDDWIGRASLLDDPARDAEDGLLDFTTGYAFTNQDALYLLVEVVDPTALVTEFNVWFKVGSKPLRFQWQVNWREALVSEEMPDGSYMPIGPAIHSQVAFGPALEMRVDLRDLASPEELLLESVTADIQESPNAPAHNADVWEPMTIPPTVNEIDPPREEKPSLSQVCAEVIPPVPFGSLPPAPLQFAQPDYAAEWLVQSNGIPSPQDVVATEAGEIFVSTIVAGVVQVHPDGTASQLADICTFAMDLDSEGNLIAYCMPSGDLQRVTLEGQVETIATLPGVPFSSPFAVSPDGSIYVAINASIPNRSKTTSVYQVKPDGMTSRVFGDMPDIIAMDFDPEGNLLVAIGERLAYLSLKDGTLETFIDLPDSVSYEGMDITDDGTIYVSVGAHGSGGRLFRIPPEGILSEVARIEDNGLSGIDVGPSGEIVGTQLRIAGLVRVWPDGRTETIIAPLGMSNPQDIAFGSTGDLYVSNNEAGTVIRVRPDGQIIPLADDLWTYTPPLAVIAVSPRGEIFFSEAAPGSDGRMVKIDQDGRVVPFTTDVYAPCGLAFGPDGLLYVAETGRGVISRAEDDGTVNPIVEELNTPHYLIVDDQGGFLVATSDPSQPGPEPFREPELNIPEPFWILKVSSDGERQVLANLENVWWVSNMILGLEGDLYVAATDMDGGHIFRITMQGAVSKFASGFRNPAGLAFDLAGNLCVSDDQQNGISRIGGFPQGTLRIVVTGAEGTPVEGACVQVVATWPVVVGQVVTTGAEGTISVPAAPRTYTVVVNAPDCESQVLDSVQVFANQERVLEVKLDG
jgi:sugar lactone lactonase YvrE